VKFWLLGNPTMQGILCMSLGMALFAMTDTLAKWLVAVFPVPQILVVRSAVALVILLPFVWRIGWRSLATDEPGKHLIRVVLVVAEVVLFYVAVRDMQLAEVMLVYFAAPLFVTALARPLLGEIIGWRRWLAVLLGFAGVYLVLDPTTQGFTISGMLALGGSLAFALVMISTRRLRAAGGLNLIVYQTIGVFLASLLATTAVPDAWVEADQTAIFLFGLVGIGSMIAYYLINHSLLLAPAAVVAPFNYTSIVWALILGYVFFGDLPTIQGVMGGFIIVAAGLYIMYRESRQKQSVTSFQDGNPA